MATEELAPGSIVFPSTADGESPNAQVAARLWKSPFTQLSSLEGTMLTSLPNALAEFTKAGSHLIAACGGDVATLAQTVGSGVFNPFVNVYRVRSWFGGVKHFPQIDKLSRMMDHGAPVDVRPIDPDPAELGFGNHQSAKDHDEVIWKKVAADVATGRAIIFEASRAEGTKRLRISPLGVVQGSKLQIIHDLSFAPARNWMRVNHLTDFEQAPRVGLGHVLPDVLNRIMYLRQRFGPLAHIVMSKVDVKDAFR